MNELYSKYRQELDIEIKGMKMQPKDDAPPTESRNKTVFINKYQVYFGLVIAGYLGLMYYAIGG